VNASRTGSRPGVRSAPSCVGRATGGCGYQRTALRATPLGLRARSRAGHSLGPALVGSAGPMGEVAGDRLPSGDPQVHWGALTTANVSALAGLFTPVLPVMAPVGQPPAPPAAVILAVLVLKIGLNELCAEWQPPKVRRPTLGSRKPHRYPLIWVISGHSSPARPCSQRQIRRSQSCDHGNLRGRAVCFDPFAAIQRQRARVVALDHFVQRLEVQSTESASPVLLLEQSGSAGAEFRVMQRARAPTQVRMYIGIPCTTCS
jgi:hypothetical protein